jgi:hypothetical protein
VLINGRPLIRALIIPSLLVTFLLYSATGTIHGHRLSPSFQSRWNMWQVSKALEILRQDNADLSTITARDLEPYCEPRHGRNALIWRYYWLEHIRPELSVPLVTIGFMVLASLRRRRKAAGAGLVFLGLVCWFSRPIVDLVTQPDMEYLNDYSVVQFSTPGECHWEYYGDPFYLHTAVFERQAWSWDFRNFEYLCRGIPHGIKEGDFQALMATEHEVLMN